MKSLTKQFLDRELSRREFALGIAALGFSGAAAESIAAAVETPAAGVATQGTPFRGSGGDVLAECLKAAQAEYVFDTNSTGQTSFYDALMTRPDLKMIVALQEGQAVSMAHGYELASGKPGFLMLPSIGMPNAMSNLYNAWKDRSALVAFSDGSDTALAGRDGFQQIDGLQAMTAPFTKWQWSVNFPARIPEMVRRGIKLATTPTGGPVYVRIPKNVLSAADLDVTLYPQQAFAVGARMAPKSELIEQAARHLIEAENPMLNVGGEVSRAGAVEAVVKLAELLSIPVTQGYSVFGDFPNGHPLFHGYYSMGFPRGLAGIDVFMNLGSPIPDATLVTAPPPKQATLINVQVEYDRIANIYPTDLSIAAGVAETTQALVDAISGMTTKRRRREIGEARLAKAEKGATGARDRRNRRARRGWDAAPMYAERLCYELDQWLDRDACLIVETGDRSPQAWIDYGPGSRTLIGPTTGFALGWASGAAIGVRIARPGTQTVALVGDGAMLFGQLESLWTASRYDVPITIIVFNNRSYDAERGRIHFASPVARADKSAWQDMSCYLGNPDVNFVTIAGGFGIDGAVAMSPDEFRAALKRARAVNDEGRPFMIDAAVARRGPAAESTWHPDVSIA